MLFHPPRTRRRAHRAIIAAVTAVATMLVLQMSSALGAPQSQLWTGQAGGPTPDIERTDLLYFLPNGAQGPGGAAGTINLTLDGVPVVAYCIETTKFLNQNNPGPIADVTEVPLATPEDRAVLWILQNRTPTGAVTPAKQDEAATSQVAVWVLRGELRATNPTSSPSINAAAAALDRRGPRRERDAPHDRADRGVARGRRDQHRRSRSPPSPARWSSSRSPPARAPCRRPRSRWARAGRPRSP